MAPSKTRLVRVNWPERQLVGWRVQFSSNRKRVIRFFSDRKFKGNRKALAAAQEFATAATRHLQELLHLQRRLNPRSNTRFSIPRITRIEAKNNRSAFWVAYWSNVKGVNTQRKFSVKKFGEREAKSMAIRARLNAIRKHQARFEKLTRQKARTDFHC